MQQSCHEFRLWLLLLPICMYRVNHLRWSVWVNIFYNRKEQVPVHIELFECIFVWSRLIEIVNLDTTLTNHNRYIWISKLTFLFEHKVSRQNISLSQDHSAVSYVSIKVSYERNLSHEQVKDAKKFFFLPLPINYFCAEAPEALFWVIINRTLNYFASRRKVGRVRPSSGVLFISFLYPSKLLSLGPDREGGNLRTYLEIPVISKRTGSYC